MAQDEHQNLPALRPQNVPAPRTSFLGLFKDRQLTAIEQEHRLTIAKLYAEKEAEKAELHAKAEVAIFASQLDAIVRVAQHRVAIKARNAMTITEVTADLDLELDVKEVMDQQFPLIALQPFPFMSIA